MCLASSLRASWAFRSPRGTSKKDEDNKKDVNDLVVEVEVAREAAAAVKSKPAAMDKRLQY